jgi:hypothetical protein
MVTADWPQISRWKNREEIRDIVMIQEKILAKMRHKLLSLHQYTSRNCSNAQLIAGRASTVKQVVNSSK